MITKTIMTLGIIAGFVVGISFSSVYAGIPWGTNEIADDAITSKKIKDKQVKKQDIRNNAITSNKIIDGTIQSADIAPGLSLEIQTLSEGPSGVISLSGGGGSVTVQDRVTGECGPGSSIRKITSDGFVTCEVDNNLPPVYNKEENHSILGFDKKFITMKCNPGDIALNVGFEGGTSFNNLSATNWIVDGFELTIVNGDASTHNYSVDVLCFDT